MKIYYSHAMLLYGTKLEKIEKRQILKNFPDAKIVDPGSFQNNLEKRLGGIAMLRLYNIIIMDTKERGRCPICGVDFPLE